LRNCGLILSSGTLKSVVEQDDAMDWWEKNADKGGQMKGVELCGEGTVAKGGGKVENGGAADTLGVGCDLYLQETTKDVLEGTGWNETDERQRPFRGQDGDWASRKQRKRKVTVEWKEMKDKEAGGRGYWFIYIG
jgi:hypothetical protein